MATPMAPPPPPPLGMEQAAAAYAGMGIDGATSKGSARGSFRTSARASLSGRPLSTPQSPGKHAPVNHGAIATTSAALGLRRTSWQLHLPPSLQRAFARATVIMDGPVVLCIIVLATLVAIFLEDIKVTSFEPSDDWIFVCITLALWSLFLLELLINSVVKAGYFHSFFFYLDLVSVFSLLPEIPWLWNPMIGLRQDDGEDGGTDAAFEVARIRRVSRVSVRLLQVLKFVKLIRLGRIAKLFEMAQRTMEERARQQRRASRIDTDGMIHASDWMESSQVGSALSEQTTRKVVLLVLLMMCGVPLLQPTFEEGREDYIVGELNYMASNSFVLGQVWARVEGDGRTLTALRPNETAGETAAGHEVVQLHGSFLSDMLLQYDPNLGQPYPDGDPTILKSPAFNHTYLDTILSAQNRSVAIRALEQARDTMEQQFQWTLAHLSSTVLYLHIRGSYFSNDYTKPELFHLRTAEMKAAEDGTGGGGKSFGIFSIRSQVKQSAEYSIWRTVTVLVLLTLGALAFNHNNQRMVIEPIERMVATIVQLQKNPLARAVIERVEGGELTAAAAKHQAKHGGKPDGGGGGGSVASSSSSSSSNETGMLERTLQKLTGLLQVGFGEAGSRMIQKCMSQNAEGDLDPMVDGTRMLAIFGFCDIRRFTDATECLREDVMMYVNEIAAIVHSHVSMLDGHPNKNVGDAFLVVWRLKPFNAHLDADDLFQLNEKQERYLRPPLELVRKRATMASQAERDYADEVARQREQLQLLERAKQAAACQPPIVRSIPPLTLVQLSIQADKSVVSFLRIIVDLDASTALRAYEAHPRIQAAFADFSVQLGFGLHCGWAIEGPIGSRFKIDASYLSPSVNLSEALQDLTKQYAAPLLVSGEFYTLLSPYLKSFMRRLDVVKVAGRDTPMNLYAFDVHPAALRSVVSGVTPEEYDADADIEVVELKSSYFNKYRVHSTRDDPSKVEQEDEEEAAAAAAAAAAGGLGSGVGLASSDPMDSPLSPGPVRRVTDPLGAHALFRNPLLNPHLSDFSACSWSGEERRAAHARGPIATYHLVYNYRLSVLQCAIPYDFYDLYARGLEQYLDGDWTAARETLESARALYPEDGATAVVMDVMQQHDFVAPPSWPGWHEA